MKKIETDKAPKALGPYSQAITGGGFVFCSGQIGINPRSNKLVRGGIKNETKQTLKNLKNVLEAAGTDISCVVRTDVYLKDINDFDGMNEMYAETFNSIPRPARVTIEAAGLPKGALVEIACTAFKK